MDSAGTAAGYGQSASLDFGSACATSALSSGRPEPRRPSRSRPLARRRPCIRTSAGRAAWLPAGSACAASSVPATGLSLRSPRGGQRSFPGRGRSLGAGFAGAVLVPPGNILPARDGRWCGPLPARRLPPDRREAPTPPGPAPSAIRPAPGRAPSCPELTPADRVVAGAGSSLPPPRAHHPIHLVVKENCHARDARQRPRGRRGR